MNRRKIWERRRGYEYHAAIEGAVKEDGSCPATEFLTPLSRGLWRGDPKRKSPKDFDQIHDYAQLMAKIEHVGIEGSPDTGTSVNDLEDGIWEFKHADRRLTFWDTPGDGTFTPKPRIRDRTTIKGPETPDFWWYPRMDEFLRLGCAWPKEGQMAPADGIAHAKVIREEDCAHDRPSPPEPAELEAADGEADG